MEVKLILKIFVYIFIISWITLIILNNVSPKKEGFDINTFINEDSAKRRPMFYTEAEAGAVDFGITTAIATINVTLGILAFYLFVTLLIPIAGWIMAIGITASIITALATQAILAAQWVKPNDPKTLAAADHEICGIQTEINNCEAEISDMKLKFDTLKYAFKTNKIYIKTEAKKILKYLDQTTELIHDMYFPYINDPSSNIPMVQFYKDLKYTRIHILTISDEHTLRKDLDVKSSDIDITLLDDRSFKYYIKYGNEKDKNKDNAKNITSKREALNCDQNGNPNAPNNEGDIKADITNFIIIMTYEVGDGVSKMKCFVNEHLQKYPESKKKKKHSISEHNRKKMNQLFIKMKPTIDQLLEHIDTLKETIAANGKIFERRDELRKIIADDQKLIKEIEAYKIPHFFTATPPMPKRPKI
jgi:hypothetical protein